ncbi:hypothetical protein Tco_1319153 [Tanacetum coccineum]
MGLARPLGLTREVKPKARVLGKPLEKVASSCDYDSEDAVASIDNEMANFRAKKDGYGTQSLLEQWTESYKNDDYRYDPYDDDMYEGQDIPDKLQAICDKLDITIKGHQFLNETFIVEILKIGVRIGVEIPVPFGEEDEIGVLVNKKDVKMVVECLMDTADEEGKQRRKRATEPAEMAKRVMAEGGSSYHNISSLIQDITQAIKIQLK